MKGKRILIAALLLLCLMLCACGKYSAKSVTGVFTAEDIAKLEKYKSLDSADLRGSDCYDEILAYIAAHPDTEVLYDVDIGAARVPSDCRELSLDKIEYDDALLRQNSKYLGFVETLRLGAISPGDARIETLRALFPNVRICYTVGILGAQHEQDAKEIDLSAMDAGELDAVCAALPLLEELETINLIKPDGSCAFDTPELEKLHKAAPEAELLCSFELFGKTVSSDDERAEYDGEEIGEAGAERFRQVLPWLTNLKYLMLADCGISNETMAKLRDDFPQVKIVWRVYVYQNGYMTDVERIRTQRIDDAHSHDLMYCTDVKYVDFGHNQNITKVDFLGYMPKLEVAVLASSAIRDISPLKNCPELEYLEIFFTPISDLGPLAACAKLEHLNISNMRNMKDISPLYSLENLKRIRLVCTKIPQEQLDELAARIPGIEIQNLGWNSVAEDWRYYENGDIVPRYALLREQMGYDDDDGKK